MIYACTPLWVVCVFSSSGGIPQLESDWSLSCDHGTDLIMRVNVRTTTRVVSEVIETADALTPKVNGDDAAAVLR